jgi:hypothetical protein
VWIRGCLVETAVVEARANTYRFVTPMTDGEMKVRHMPSSSINQTALATSEDLRWGMIWPLLVCLSGVQMNDSTCSDGLGSA